MGKHTDPRGIKLSGTVQGHQVQGEGSGWFMNDPQVIRGLGYILLAIVVGTGMGFAIWWAIMLAVRT